MAPFKRWHGGDEAPAVGFGEGFAYNRKVEEVIGDYFDLIDNSACLIQSVMPDGRYLYVNRTWRETLGYSREDVAGLTFLDVIHPDYHEHCGAVFEELMSGKSYEAIECDFVTRDGGRIGLRGNVSCRFEGGKPVATRGVFERAEGAGALSEKESEAEELFLEFRDLVGA